MERSGEDPQKSIGTLLCATRMRLGKDLQQVAEILHIRYNYLVAIEDGRYEDLPGQAYAIGFVRAYADHLGLDGSEIVRRYKEQSSGTAVRTVFDFPLPAPDSGVPSGLLILVAVVLGMVVYGVWYAVAGSERAAVEVIQEVPDRLTGLLKTNETPEQAAGVPAPDAAIVGAPGSAEDTEASAERAVPATLPAESPAAPVSAGSGAPQVAAAVPASGAVLNTPHSDGQSLPPDVVELRAKSDIWITLRTPEKADRTQLLRKGEVLRAPDGVGLTLVTARPSDLEILLNGKVMPPLDAGVFARGVPLDPQRLRAGAPP